jgi:hypothetical protein
VIRAAARIHRSIPQVACHDHCKTAEEAFNCGWRFFLHGQDTVAVNDIPSAKAVGANKNGPFSGCENGPMVSIQKDV